MLILAFDTAAPVGFDVYSRLKDGVAVENRALAGLVVDGSSALYRIDLLTGSEQGTSKIRFLPDADGFRPQTMMSRASG